MVERLKLCCRNLPAGTGRLQALSLARKTISRGIMFIRRFAIFFSGAMKVMLCTIAIVTVLGKLISSMVEDSGSFKVVFCCILQSSDCLIKGSVVMI